MANIEPFLSLHYNPEVIPDVSKVICPPYDVISPQEQEECYQRHPYNFIRVILGKELSSDSTAENNYARAAAYIAEWQRRNILIQDKEPGIYFYEQKFSCLGKKSSRLGVIVLLRLEDDGENKTVYPHENTHTAPKEDRFALIKSVEANLSPIFTVFSDENTRLERLFAQEVKEEAPLFDAVDSAGGENKVWAVRQESAIEELRSLLKGKEVFIADGHHRYEVARMFRDHKRQNDPAGFKDSYNYIMTYFTPLEADGLCILPTHRLLKNISFAPSDLGKCFGVREIPSKEDLVSEMKSKESEVGVFGLYKDRKFYLLKVTEKRECNRFIQEGPKEYKNLDVAILHNVIFENLLKVNLGQVSYEVDLESAVRSVDNKACDALFILNPTKIEQIRSIALGGRVMPQKSTYFYPKLMSGLLIHKFQ